MALGITFGAGQRVSATDLNAMVAQIDSLTAPGWTDYSATFAITASSVNPTKGNSTYAAFYRRAASGDVIDYKFNVTIGSTFVAGTGDYIFPLPVAATSDAAFAIGAGHILDNGTGFYPTVVRVKTSLTGLEMFRAPLGAALTAAVGSTGPGTAWATGDIIQGTIRYRV